MISLTDYQRKEFVYKFLALEIWLIDMLKSKKITKKQEKEIRLKLKPLRYLVHLNSPKFKNNEELKKQIKVCCLNDFASFSGFNQFRFTNGQNPT